MTIETKFAPGEMAWLMENNRAIDCEVTSLEVSVRPDGLYHNCNPLIGYRLKHKGDVCYCESILFTTKAELLASL